MNFTCDLELTRSCNMTFNILARSSNIENNKFNPWFLLPIVISCRWRELFEFQYAMNRLQFLEVQLISSYVVSLMNIDKTCRKDIKLNTWTYLRTMQCWPLEVLFKFIVTIKDCLFLIMIVMLGSLKCFLKCETSESFLSVTSVWWIWLNTDNLAGFLTLSLKLFWFNC